MNVLLSDGKEYYCEKHDVFNQSCSVSFSSLNQMQLNVPEPVEPRENTNTFPDSDEDYPTENNLNQTDFSHTKPIVIESEHTKYDKFRESDSANHSFDDGIDVVDGVKQNTNGDYDAKEKVPKKIQGNSVDSGISNNMNGTVNGINGKEEILENGHVEIPKTELISNLSVDKLDSDKKSLPSRLSDLSLKDSDTTLNKDTSSDEDKFESDQEISPRLKINGTDKKNGVSLNLKFQSEMRYDIICLF